MSGRVTQTENPLVVIVCNALDDTTRLERDITTDSPAASRKVFQMAKALKAAGIRPIVLSLGRGRANGSNKAFATKVCRVDRITTIYAPFSHKRFASELFSLFGLLKSFWRLSKHSRRAAIFYNRMPAYLLLLRASSCFGYRSFLDLEDGEVISDRSLRLRLARMVTAHFDKHCSGGALLACSALSTMTTVRPVHCYYGTSMGDVHLPRWKSDRITCLMSGSLEQNTGAHLLIEAIRLLRTSKASWSAELSFEVTGKGSSLMEFERLAAEPGFPQVRVHGRVSDLRYTEILRGCDVGLALKPVGGILANTTFPSKVIEFAGSGLLVLSTDISDVRRLFGDGALYLERNDPELLIKQLAEIIADRDAAERCAIQGRESVERHCSMQRAGEDLRCFLFGR